jgi:hypothetical protein
MFNYSTTDFALRDLLGNLEFAGLRWATILSIAFCGIDFAGIARLFTPEQGGDEPKEIWYLFGAWLLAATMNAMLTWWGVSMAIVNHSPQSTAVIDTKTLTHVMPVFVAVMVWVIRILIIGTISVAGDRFIWGGARRSQGTYSGNRLATPARTVTAPIASPSPAPRSSFVRPVDATSSLRPEPSYHSMSGRGSAPEGGTRKL